MIRLQMVVEGLTEEGFVNQVLREHLTPKMIFVSAHCVMTSKKRNKVFRGGGRSYQVWRNDINRWLKGDTGRNAIFTTMIDLYAFPSDFPGYDDAKGISDPYQRVAFLEEKFAEEIGSPRFIPYIQLHEFEALVLTVPDEILPQFPQARNAVNDLSSEVNQFSSPELIDDGETTAPSKRIISRIPGYEGRKSIVGPQIVRKIGLEKIRTKCPHFNKWLTHLEELESRSCPPHPHPEMPR